MSAPSVDHEARVELLRSIATLSGYGCDVAVGNELMPDVTRLARRSRGLFVGDAKATETSGCAATSERLENYLRAARRYHARGRPLLLLVAHGDRHDEQGWVATLRRVLRRSGMRAPDAVGSFVIDEQDVIAYAVLSAGERSASDT